MKIGISFILAFTNHFLLELVPRLDSLSPLHCVSLCSLHPQCQSVFYQPPTRECVLAEDLYTTTEGLSIQSGWKYFVDQAVVVQKSKDAYPRFKVLFKTQTLSAIYDLSLEEWSPFNSTLQEFYHDFDFNGGDDLYACSRREIDLVSLTTGKLIQLGWWETSESIYALAVDLEYDLLFYVTLVDEYELNRMNPRNKSSSMLLRSSRESFAKWLSLDRDRKIVFAAGERGREYWAASMKYDGSEVDMFALSTETITTDIVFDKKANALVFTTSSGVYSYILTTKKTVKISSAVSSPRQVDMFGDFIVVVNETRTYSSLVVLSRRGKVLYDLENPHGQTKDTVFRPARIQIIY